MDTAREEVSASQKIDIIEYRLKNSPDFARNAIIEERLKNSPLHLLTQKRELKLASSERVNNDSSGNAENESSRKPNFIGA